MTSRELAAKGSGTSIPITRPSGDSSFPIPGSQHEETHSLAERVMEGKTIVILYEDRSIRIENNTLSSYSAKYFDDLIMMTLLQ